MTLKELTGKLGIETYPEKFDEIYENSKNLDLSFCDLGKIKEFNEKYDNVFKEYTDAVLDGAKALSENKELLTYCAVVCEYLICGSDLKVCDTVVHTAKRERRGILIGNTRAAGERCIFNEAVHLKLIFDKVK